jgi:hypothetical protein
LKAVTEAAERYADKNTGLDLTIAIMPSYEQSYPPDVSKFYNFCIRT